MCWRECILLCWCFMKWLSSFSQLWLHLRLYSIKCYFYRITKNCVKRCFFLHKCCVKLPIIKQHPLTHLPKTHDTRLIVITSICLQRIIIKMSKNLFFSFFSQLGACIMIAQLTRDQRHTQISNWETTILKVKVHPKSSSLDPYIPAQNTLLLDY